MRVVLTLFVLWALPAQAANLYVNNTGSPACSDATAKASNSASAPWCTIGRAAWGSTNRAAPVSGEAAAAGDVVLITGGTYTNSSALSSRFAVLYDPVNNGTVGNFIEFRCVGTCVLGAQNLFAPIIGATSSNYVKWFADVSLNYQWTINAHGLIAGGATVNQVQTTPDTGPVVCHLSTGCWVEGAVIDGGVQTDYTDNWEGFRVEEAVDTTIRNNIAHNFYNATNTANSTCITIYYSNNTLFEHNYCYNTIESVRFKDVALKTQTSNIIRLNKLDPDQSCFGTTMTGQPRSDVYQNLCLGGTIGSFSTGGGFNGLYYYNNTFVNFTEGVYWANNSGSGLTRYWNNIWLTTTTALSLNGFSMPAESVVDMEHNIYRTFTTFYSGSDGTRTFASYLAAYPNQDQAAPASITSDPLLANVAGGDYRLCTAAGVPHASCSGASPAINLGRAVDGGATINAGAYLTNLECMGVENTCTSTTAPVRLRFRDEDVLLAAGLIPLLWRRRVAA